MTPEGITEATNIGIVLLAAGNSSRLGHPKQLLSYRGSTLLNYSLTEAKLSNAQPIVVVLGSGALEIKKQIGRMNIHLVENEEWQEGMASSIRCGVKLFRQIAPGAEGVILMVCDQPFVTTSLINELISAHQKTGKAIVACGYENTFGPPVFFHRSFFNKLLQLTGDAGARAVVLQHRNEVELISFPQGTYDVDTETDYENLNKIEK